MQYYMVTDDQEDHSMDDMGTQISDVVWWRNASTRYLCEAVKSHLGTANTVDLYIFDRASIGGTFGGNRTITDSSPITLTSTTPPLGSADVTTLNNAITTALAGKPGADV